MKEVQEALFQDNNIDQKKRVQKRKGGLGQGPLQKETNLKLGIPNLFLMYSPLKETGTEGNHVKSKEDKDKPMSAKPFAQLFYMKFEQCLLKLQSQSLITELTSLTLIPSILIRQKYDTTIHKHSL
jgi:hypothetical protein